ncbi:hypothetical protein ABZ403_31495 [Micromonospora zamorensis]|uniref:hypothetical protein n=1 Tax=Micromonospora zamorensis TaxID=709883 RepID=UPI0033C9DFAA
MAEPTFRYHLLFRPENAEVPVNVIALLQSSGPTQAVIWDRPTSAWTFRPEVATAVLYASPERHLTRAVDRVTTEWETVHCATVPLPTEAELTDICRLTASTRSRNGQT